MRKSPILLILPLSLALLACLISIPALAAQENLALNRPYVCSDEILAGWTGLTDGVTDSDAPPGCFATSGSSRFPKQIVIDLGALCLISKINLINSGNGNTRHVALSISADASTYEQLREYIFPPDAVQPLVHTFTPRQARYVKITLLDSWGGGAQGPNCLFLREVQVFGEPPAGGLTVSGREELRLAHLPPQFTTTPSVALFRRYGLTPGRQLRVGVLGDSFAAVTLQQTQPWPELLPGLLEDKLGPGHVQLLNLAGEDQSPTDALAVAKPLLSDPPVDLLFLAYGRDAALADLPLPDFRRAFDGLINSLLDTPALLVVVTPPPLLAETGAQGHSVLPYAQAEEELASRYGLPVVRSAAALAAAPDPLACFSGSQLTDAGQLRTAQAIQRLLSGTD